MAQGQLSALQEGGQAHAKFAASKLQAMQIQVTDLEKQAEDAKRCAPARHVQLTLQAAACCDITPGGWGRLVAGQAGADDMLTALSCVTQCGEGSRGRARRCGGGGARAA